jgi:hypothetical protein
VDLLINISLLKYRTETTALPITTGQNMTLQMHSVFSLLLAGFAAAKTCTNLTIPVDISSRQGLFKKFPIEGNIDAGAFATAYNQQGRNYSQTLLQDFQTLKGSYEISAEFCHPDGGIASSIVQVLSHGIGFDKTYVQIYLILIAKLTTLGIGISLSTTTTTATWRLL